MPNSTQAYYDTHAEEYFRLTSGLTLTPQWEKFTNKLQPNARILDLGSGSGRDLRFFVSLGFRVVGLDKSFSLLRLSQSFTDQAVLQADLTTLPFQVNSFDAVWAMGSLLHVSPSLLPQAFTEIARILRPGGYLFTSVKRGSGMSSDNGRETYLHEKIYWADRLCQHDFRIVSCDITLEERSASSSIQHIEWIETLAQTEK